MIQAYSVEQVREAEEALLAQTPDGELMRRASTGLAEVLRARAEQLDARRLVVLVGPGNNGGDALHAAAMVSDGLAVVVVQVASRPHPGGARAVADAGVPVHVLDRDATQVPEDVRTALAEADLVVDGLLGIGGTPGLRGAMAAVVDAIGEHAYVVAVDLPSGADPAGRTRLEDAVFADETVTFGVPKPVHLLPATEPAVGRLTVVDIGLTLDVPPAVERLDFDDVRALWPVPGADDDKYSRGVLGVVAGGETFPGAAVLCTVSAVEAGVGMVRYLGPPTPTGLVLRAVPEAVTRPGRVQAWVLGPGLDPEDTSVRGRVQVRTARRALESDDPCVVDAGALDLLSGRRAAPTLLTPHAGELARLLSRLVGGPEVERATVQADPVRHARIAAEVTGAVVLLKGATTVVVGPGAHDPVRVQADAPAWLATAGSGDVLAGLTGALLASGLDPLDAAPLAALVHGVAGDRANPGGPVRALAVAHALPRTVAYLLHR
jgi:ADP-dependent NAD(P)H-hydrate dehydratase / NAD(P)H-hydrate epimerase